MHALTRPWSLTLRAISSTYGSIAAVCLLSYVWCPRLHVSKLLTFHPTSQSLSSAECPWNWARHDSAAFHKAFLFYIVSNRSPEKKRICLIATLLILVSITGSILWKLLSCLEPQKKMFCVSRVKIFHPWKYTYYIAISAMLDCVSGVSCSCVTIDLTCSWFLFLYFS
jgi:hypothetical protein